MYVDKMTTNDYSRIVDDMSTNSKKGGKSMNYMELETAIKDSGIMKSRIADKIGISRQALYLKLNGEREFTQKEVFGLKQVLHLSDEKFLQIFFNDHVDEMPTEA